MEQYKKTIIVFVSLFLFTLSLSAQNSNDNFSIAGEIHGAKDGTVIKLVDIDQQDILDSASSQNGKFILKDHVDIPTGCWLQCMNEYAIIQVENVNMSFESPLKNMVTSYIATGGREQDLQNRLNKLKWPYDRVSYSAYDSLIKKLFTNDADKDRLINVLNNTQGLSQKIYVEFGKQNINSYMALDIILRNRKTIPKDTVTVLYNDLKEEYKNTAKARALKTFLYEKIVGKGERMIDFDVKTITGKSFRLSSLKGQYIYLAFGSAGCGPCRMENKEISKNYDRLSKEMAIVYFSLDKNIKYWQIATKEDKIIWNNVSDMEGSNGRIKTLYNVQSMPTSFLIDRNGVIIEKIEWYDPLTIENLEKIIQSAK